jgi:hypothetical protein
LLNDELSVESIIKNFSKILHIPASFLPRHNSRTELPSKLPSKLPAKLLTAPLVWVRQGGVIPPLQLLYDGPYAVLPCGPCSFTIRVRSRDEVVAAVSHLKACTAADSTPGSPRCHSRLPGSRPGGPAATKRVSFSDLLVSSPSSSPAPLQNSPGTIFLHGKEIFARPGPVASSQPPQTRSLSRQSMGTAQEFKPLTSRGQSLGGALWRVYTPGDH